MYYSRIEESGNGLILRRNSSLKIFYWLLLVFSVICLLPGLILIFDPDTGFTANFVLGFGLVFIAGALLLNDLRKKFPEQIEFLNQEQMVKVSGHQKEHLFSYSQIDHFFRRSTREGSTISVMKKDGSVWDLMATNSIKGAERRLALIREKIEIKREITHPEINYQLPPSFQKSELGGKAYFYWKEAQVEKQLFLLFMMVAGFGTMLGHSLKEGNNYHAFVLCYLSVLVLIAASFTYSAFIARTNYSMLSFDKDAISYGKGKIPTMNVNPEFKAKRTMAASELDSVRYSFDGYHSFFYSIMLLDKETVKGINQLEGENSYVAVMDIGGVLKTYKHLFKFNISGKDVIDIANFAAALKQTAHDKYGK